MLLLVCFVGLRTRMSDKHPHMAIGFWGDFLSKAAEEGYYLWLEHDAHNPIITVKNTEKGVRLDKSFEIEEVIN